LREENSLSYPTAPATPVRIGLSGREKLLYKG